MLYKSALEAHMGKAACLHGLLPAFGVQSYTNWKLPEGVEPAAFRVESPLLHSQNQTLSAASRLEQA